MDIPNLSNQTIPKVVGINYLVLAILFFVAIGSGFGLSRLFPSDSSSSTSMSKDSAGLINSNVVNPDSIKTSQDIEVGKSYGNTSQNFKDSAIGTLELGSVNGEGTHILNREGGVTQRAALTSSILDLDLFVGHKIEVKGETNTSKKAGWLMDVGIVKVLQ